VLLGGREAHAFFLYNHFREASTEFYRSTAKKKRRKVCIRGKEGADQHRFPERLVRRGKEGPSVLLFQGREKEKKKGASESSTKVRGVCFQFTTAVEATASLNRYQEKGDRFRENCLCSSPFVKGQLISHYLQSRERKRSPARRVSSRQKSPTNTKGKKKVDAPRESQSRKGGGSKKNPPLSLISSI